MSPRGGARAGSGRKKGKRTSETVQITARVKPKTAASFGRRLSKNWKKSADFDLSVNGCLWGRYLTILLSNSDGP